MNKLDKLLVLAGKFFAIKGHADELNKVVSVIGKAKRRPGQLPTSNENLGLLRTLANEWKGTLSTYSQKDINWWLEWSGADLFSPRDSKESVKKLKETLAKVKALKSACNGLEQLAYVVLVADNMDVKGLVTAAYVPSLVAIDAQVAKETARSFKSCQYSTDKLIKVLQSALPAAVENYEGSMNMRAVFSQLR